MNSRVLAIFIACVAPCWVYAAAGAGSTGAQFLNTPVNARIVSMGGAFTAVSDDVGSIHSNPAGLALLRQQQISAMYQKQISDLKTEFIGYALPLPDFGLFSDSTLFPNDGRRTALGVSLLMSQKGELDLIETNSDGSFSNAKTVSAGSDMLVSVAYGAEIGDWFGSEEQLIGGSARYLKSTLAGKYSAHTYSFDLGYLAVTQVPGLRLGCAVQNIGGGIKFKEEEDRLPLTFRLGTAWMPLGSSEASRRLTLALDGGWDREGQLSGMLGVEYWFYKQAALRSGYQLGNNFQTWSLGVGFKLPAMFPPGDSFWGIDYAFVPIGDLGATHYLSLSMEFGQSRSRR